MRLEQGDEGRVVEMGSRVAGGQNVDGLAGHRKVVGDTRH